MGTGILVHKVYHLVFLFFSSTQGLYFMDYNFRQKYLFCLSLYLHHSHCIVLSLSSDWISIPYYIRSLMLYVSTSQRSFHPIQRTFYYLIKHIFLLHSPRIHPNFIPSYPFPQRFPSHPVSPPLPLLLPVSPTPLRLPPPFPTTF